MGVNNRYFFPTVQPTHCVVDFTEENNLSLVPAKKLNNPVESVKAGCDCMVGWAKKKQLFKATVMGVGKFSAIASSSVSQNFSGLPTITQLVHVQSRCPMMLLCSYI